MDTSQHYQPLLHALQPVATSEHIYYPKPASPQLERGEEDEEDEGDEHQHSVHEIVHSGPNSPSGKTLDPPQNSPPTDSEHKRRRGRPRGSKNRRSRSDNEQSFAYQPPQPEASTSQQQPEVNPQNQQYYEFQWKILNLCSEFYGAAEAMIKSTPALVIAQCYNIGPGNKVDPLFILSEAKRTCDILIANPSRLVTSPPPPMYPAIPSFSSLAGSSSASVTNGLSSTPVTISQPQSFIVPMGSQQIIYPLQPVPYYQYPGYSQYYNAMAPPQAPPLLPTSNAPSVSGTTQQGNWSEEEVDKLKNLSKESRDAGNTGEQEWTYVVAKWGNGRTRHQILIKATQLGLKESSTVKPVKRRRGAGDDAVSPGQSVPPPGTHSSSAPSPRDSTPSASPSLQSRTVVGISLPTSAGSMPWSMPTVAATTPSPILDQSQPTSYYRPRPTDASAKPVAGPSHGYMYRTGK